MPTLRQVLAVATSAALTDGETLLIVDTNHKRRATCPNQVECYVIEEWLVDRLGALEFQFQSMSCGPVLGMAERLASQWMADSLDRESIINGWEPCALRGESGPEDPKARERLRVLALASQRFCTIAACD